MASVNKDATHKFVTVLNEKSSFGKLLSATGQLALSLYHDATPEQQSAMSFTPLLDPKGNTLITVTTCSFVVLKGTGSQLLTLYIKAQELRFLSALFTSTMSFNGIEEDLILKTATTSLDLIEPYGISLFGKIEDINSLTKKFSVFKI